MPNDDNFEWTTHATETLRALWSQGLPAAEIGLALSISKSAVLGKAHRIPLPARRLPAPAKKASPPTRRRSPAKKQRDPSLPAAAEVSEPVVPAARPKRSFTISRATGQNVSLGKHTCCWPIGDPGTESFRYCAEAKLPGKPYCAEHAARAYVSHRARDGIDANDTGVAAGVW